MPSRRALFYISIFLTSHLHAFAFPTPKDDPDRQPWRQSFKYASDIPNVQVAVHSVGNVNLTVINIGQFGTGYIGATTDPATGQIAPSCIFPTGSNTNYLYVGAFWIGAVVGRDTLVSIGVDDFYRVVEFWPESGTRGQIARRSIQPGNAFFSDDAVSEQDIIAIYTDTLTNPQYVAMDNTDGRPHIPLGIEVTQSSYAWSYDYAQDFILFDYSIKNIGRKNLSQVYMGIYVDGDVSDKSVTGSAGYMDDLCGFKRDFPAGTSCNFLDTINMAYIIDNDGDPVEESSWGPSSCRGAAGVRVVRTPSDSLLYSFNWWVTNYDPSGDFGPRQTGKPDDPFRDLGGVLGTPSGDRNKYYIMRHQEFDYDQLFTAQDHTSQGWLPPPNNAADIADGFDARYLLSFGPFEIYPGETLPLTFAYICGENVHINPTDFKRFYNSAAPEVYYSKLDFSDLAKNSRWASWIYDNPNYDTDGDSIKGKSRICCVDSSILVDTTVVPPETTITCLKSDTSYYEGDGVPDFRGASPPPAPTIRILPRYSNLGGGELIVRWNGLRSETTRDVFSNRVDFEGYRVYQALTPRIPDFSLLSSYDIEDYNRWIWNRNDSRWMLIDPPFTLDSLRLLYGDNFQPLAHDIDNPFYFSGDSTFYFTRQDWNLSDPTNPIGIHRRYPDQPYPSTLNADSAAKYSPDELTEDGYFKYFEYEYIIKNLLPSQLYYISVTAFDYGSPGHGLTALETKVTSNMLAEYPQNSADLVEAGGLNVIAYPNPYRIDARYRSPQGGGFEGRGQEELSDERVRAIHFTNLPHKCTIRIFTIDGDLVREIKHDFPPGSAQSMHDKWDLITRNTQAITSGIYYYMVESDYGRQIGKLVIIL